MLPRVLAAIGFQFILFVASYFGAIFGPLGLILQLVAAFFLIYVMPAAAIGGMPGSMAISASIRAVRANPKGSIVLALVFVLLWVVLPLFGLGYLFVGLNATPLVQSLITALVQALILGYLAFPFAKEYDEVAFRRFW